jgi:hypothetical protein
LVLDFCRFCREDLEKFFNERFQLDRVGRQFIPEEDRKGEVNPSGIVG